MHHLIPPPENDPDYVNRFPIQNLHDRMQNIIVQLLEKTSESGGDFDDYY